MIFIIIFLSTVLAFWISALCGGGASLVLIPLLNLQLSVAATPSALTLGTFTSSVSRIVAFRFYIRWTVVRYFVPAAIPAVWLGAWLIKYLNPVYLQFFIAIFLLWNVKQLLAPTRSVQAVEKPYPGYVLVIIGALAGFVSGVTGAVGLLFNRFYLKYGLSKEEIVATRAANEIILHAIKIVLYTGMGLFTREALSAGVLVAIGAILSAYSVKFLLPHISEVLFRKVGYGAMVVSGAILLTSSFSTILSQDHLAVNFKPISNSLETQFAWRNSHYSLELELDEGLQIEHEIPFNDLPESIRSQALAYAAGADEVICEKVYAWNGHTYEVYVKTGKDVKKREFKGVNAEF